MAISAVINRTDARSSMIDSWIDSCIGVTFFVDLGSLAGFEPASCVTTYGGPAVSDSSPSCVTA